MAVFAQTVLVADIGGTNTRLALAQGTTVQAKTISRYRNAEYPGLTSIIADYLSQHRAMPGRAALALAGPVAGARAEMTNLGWTIDAAEMSRATGIRQVHLLNDLQAQGHALPFLTAGHLHPICAGQPEGQTRLVIGLGTGVNAAAVFASDKGHVVPPAEAGHMHLPLHDALDFELGAWLVAQRGVASVEDVLAGSGLARLHAFHGERTGHDQQRDAAAVMTGMAQGNAQCLETGAHYVRLLAQYTASLALVTLPYAGIYYIGGVSRAIAPWLEPFGFETAFRRMGRMSPLMARFPVALVTDDFAALQGCAAFLAARG